MHTTHNQRYSLFLALITLLIPIVPPARAEGLFAAPRPPGGTYVVRVNDTLWEIASRYGITVAELTASNPDVDPNALRPGQTLSIPSETAPVSSASYIVMANDTLWGIAAKHGLFLNDLLAANPAVDPQRLRAGQVLIIPGGSGRTGQAVAVAQVSAKYTVRTDDTLWDIATNYGLSLRDLLAANSGVDPQRLTAGQALVIPGITQQALAAMQTPSQPPAAGQSPVAVPVTEQPASPPPDAGVVSQPEQPPAPTIAAGPPQTDVNPIVQAVLDQINQKRAAGGRPVLVLSPQLTAAAQSHAEDIATRNRGGHVHADGASMTDRLTRVGYRYKWHGENWANARSVRIAMDLWWNEPPGADPHVRNIMASRATEIGIGVAKGAWGYYFVTDFASQ